MVAFGEYVDDGTASAMKARDYKDATDLVAQPLTMRESGQGFWMQDNIAGTLRAEGENRTSRPSNVIAQPVAFSAKDYGADAVEGISPTLRAGNSNAGNQNSGNWVAVAHRAMQVRRLTPTECERLQGFSDGWTNIPWRGKPGAPDGPRYKALGNSMAVPCMRWIGERIAAVSEVAA